MAEYPEPPSHMPMSMSLEPHARDEAHRDQTAPTVVSRPHPVGNSADPDDHDPLAQGDLKRPRACEPCRQLKVRCVPEPSHPEGSCKRCAKARRTCIVTAPTRKRQKKTDSRVAELERKIDALTATLQHSHSGVFGLAPTVHQQQQELYQMPHREDQPGSRRWSRENSHLTGTKRSHDMISEPQSAEPPKNFTEQTHKPPASKWRGPYAGETAPPDIDAGNQDPDAIDRGLVDLDAASAAFDRYVNKMAVEMPMVVFPPGTSMSDVRRQKPALFLAIVAIAIGPFKKEVQISLITEIYQMIADRVVVKGEKSLELVQALLVLVIWYLPPDNLEEIKFYQLIHMAVILAMDIGLNRRAQGDLKPFQRIREALLKRPLGSALDLNSPEARRTWVGCYFLAVQTATALRRTQLVRWQPYMDECLNILETHPDALPSDRRVVWWAKLGFIAEEAGVQLLTDDPQSITSFADSKTRYAIRAFANQLAQWRKEIPEEIYTIPFAHSHHIVNLFVHESAMSVDCRSGDNSKSPTHDDLPTSALAPLIDALSACIHSIHQSLDAILSVDVERLICLPTVVVARTSYPVVSLIKIYSLLTASESRIGQVIDMQSLRVESYLDRIIAHYRAAAALGGGRGPAKFGHVIMMLRNWFVKKKENGPALREIFGTEMRTDMPSDKQPMKYCTTPLDLLSELATGNQTGRDLPTASRRTNSGQDGIYPGLQGMNQNPSPGPSNLATRETPSSLSRMASTQSDPPPASWSSTPSFSNLQGLQDSNLSNRGFYQGFTSSDPSHGYNGVQSSTAGAYEMSSGGIPLSQPMGIDADLGVEATFDPNNLFALGTMMDEGLFTFPFALDGSFQV